MFQLSDRTKQIIQDTTGLTWDEILISRLPKIKKPEKIVVYKYRKIKKC